MANPTLCQLSPVKGLTKSLRFSETPLQRPASASSVALRVCPSSLCRRTGAWTTDRRARFSTSQFLQSHLEVNFFLHPPTNTSSLHGKRAFDGQKCNRDEGKRKRALHMCNHAGLKEISSRPLIFSPRILVIPLEIGLRSHRG